MECRDDEIRFSGPVCNTGLLVARREMSYLYLLVAADQSSFKIGVSINPTQRMSDLPGDFDRQRSVQFKCDAQEVYKVEKTLHFLFRKHRTEKSFGDGYTEWFSIDCFNDVKNFIQNNQALLSWTEHGLVHEPTRTDKSQTGYYALSKEEREQRQEENRRLHLQACIENNTKCLSVIREWVNLLNTAGVLLGRFIENDGKQWIAIRNEGIDPHTVFSSDVKIDTTMRHKDGSFNVFGSFKWSSDCPFIFLSIEFDESEIERYAHCSINIPLVLELMQLLDEIPLITAAEQKRYRVVHANSEKQWDDFWRNEIVGKISFI